MDFFVGFVGVKEIQLMVYFVGHGLCCMVYVLLFIVLLECYYDFGACRVLYQWGAGDAVCHFQRCSVVNWVYDVVDEEEVEGGCVRVLFAQCEECFQFVVRFGDAVYDAE